MSGLTDRLTDRQRAVLEVIRTFLEREGLSPTLREIGRAMNLDTKSVAQHLDRLERKGYIARRPRQSRNIRLTASGLKFSGGLESGGSPEFQRDRGLPLVGQIAAGQPILAAENLEDRLDMDDYFGPEGGVFLLRVRGDSMMDAGIRDNDLVAVRAEGEVRDGDIAAVVLDEEATVKRFFREGALIRLVPESAGHEEMVVDPREKKVRVVGPVKGLIRRI